MKENVKKTTHVFHEFTMDRKELDTLIRSYLGVPGDYTVNFLVEKDRWGDNEDVVAVNVSKMTVDTEEEGR